MLYSGIKEKISKPTELNSIRVRVWGTVWQFTDRRKWTILLIIFLKFNSMDLRASQLT